MSARQPLRVCAMPSRPRAPLLTRAHALAALGWAPDAARVLLRVRQKLAGTEEVQTEPLSVAGQVQRLVREATDPENLARMFPGWQAWV